MQTIRVLKIQNCSVGTNRSENTHTHTHIYIYIYIRIVSITDRELDPDLVNATVLTTPLLQHAVELFSIHLVRVPDDRECEWPWQLLEAIKDDRIKREESDAQGDEGRDEGGNIHIYSHGDRSRYLCDGVHDDDTIQTANMMTKCNTEREAITEPADPDSRPRCALLTFIDMYRYIYICVTTIRIFSVRPND